MLRLIEDEDAYENYQNKAETPPVIHLFILQVIPSPTSHQNYSIKLP